MTEHRETRSFGTQPPLIEDLAAAFDARRDLARLEVRHDLGLLRHFARRAGLGIILIVGGLPLVLVSLASLLASTTTWSLATWSVLLAAVFCLPGLGLVWFAWRRLRQNVTALQQTREELLEDLAWLKEWTGNRGP